MGEVYVGTSGYDYPEWRGVLYPQELPRDQFLAFYAEHFNALELNYTYYSMPEEKHMTSMVKRSNGKLKFAVKAHKSLTHDISLSAWRTEAKYFRDALMPLTSRKLLLSVLLQFPQAFHYEVDERKYLDSLVTELEDLPLVVEFRHASWQKERVYKALRERNIGWCITDMPVLKNLPVRTGYTPNGNIQGKLPMLTANTAYLRFHGRNAASWHGTNARDRYDYLYTDSELESFNPLITTITAQAQVIQLYFNNHAKGQAVVNARKMKIMRERSPIETI